MQTLVWIALVVGCEPASMIITEMDYEDPGSPQPDPIIDNDDDGFDVETDCDDENPDVYPDAFEACNGIDDDCDEQVDEEEICPCDTIEEEGIVYSICEDPLSADDALDLCREAGMELVKIDDMAEQLLLNNWLSDSEQSSWFIGLNDRDIEDEWVWSDGSEMRWSRWNNGEPNDYGQGEDCVELRWYQDNWNDIRCDQSRPFICEFF